MLSEIVSQYIVDDNRLYHNITWSLARTDGPLPTIPWRASAPSAPWNDVGLRPATAPRGPQTFRSLQPMRLSYRLVCRVARCASAISFMLPNRKSYFGILPGGCVAPKPVWAWRR